MSLSPEQRLARIRRDARFAKIPEPVVRRCEALMLDWFGSALAGKGMRPVQTIEAFAAAMGPGEGPSEVLVSRRSTSPLFAAMVNAASSHVAEQDDVHNGSVFHPAAVVFPPALAVAQAIGASGRELLPAGVAGYEVGIRVGEFLGQPHYKIFHTTGTAGTLRGGGGGRPAARPRRRADAARVRLGGHAGRGLLGVPARRGRFQAAAHRACRGDGPDLRLSRARRLHRREADPRPAPRRWPRACRRDADPRVSSTGLASAGRSRRPRSSSTPPAATPIRRPTRCCR